MYAYIYNIIVWTALLIFPIYVSGQDYLQFENIHNNRAASTFCSFAQESSGLIWVGGADGLYSYDGYRFYPHFIPNTPQSSRINAIERGNDDYLYLGSDAGLFIYNVKLGRYETTSSKFPKNIRALMLSKNTLWIGSLDGIYTYDIISKQLKQYTPDNYPNLDNTTTYSFCLLNNNVYIGTYNGLFVYSIAEDSFRKLSLPHSSSKDNVFINTMRYDVHRNCIWIGTEGNLLKYDLRSKHLKSIEGMQNNSIKTLSLGNDGKLYVGTDFGLYIYDNEELKRYRHDSRDRFSLVNNIVWSVFTDANNNLWIGTDNGISLLKDNELIKNIPLYNLTGMSDGNLLHCIFKDSRGFYWFGGTNGLIRLERNKEIFINPIWYSVNDARYPIPHGRIRDIYEDRLHNLWIATDGGLNKYNYRTAQFEQYRITDKTEKLNANWAYNVLEDNRHRLWVSTCLGGIFVLTENELNASDRKIKANNNLNTSNGLSDMFIKTMRIDASGKVWALTYKNTLDVIDEELNVFQEDSLNITGNTYLKVADDGCVWMSYDHGVLKIDTTNQIDTIPFNQTSRLEISVMEDVDGDLWVATTQGMWIVNTQLETVQPIHIKTSKILSMYWDNSSKELLLGKADGISIVKPQNRDTTENNIRVDCSQIRVNNQILSDDVTIASGFELKPMQNDISFDITDYPYANSQRKRLIYRLLGSDDAWHSLSQQQVISFTNLKHGKYTLQIACRNKIGQEVDLLKIINFSIAPPWYLSWWAYVIYILIGTAVLLWVILYARMKNRLHMEQVNRRQAMEQSKEKVAFLQQISQQIFEPLSNIMLPASSLSFEANQAEVKERLSEVSENLTKINRLTNEIARFEDNGTGSKEPILSRFDLIKVLELLVFQQHKHNINFTSNMRVLIVELDRVKFELMFMNLLSNAIKFGENKPVQVLLNYDDNNHVLTLQLVDKGVGISAEEMPYVFQKYYKSSKLSMEGTGMGLYLSKIYAQQLGATVSLSSNEGEGTIASILLPVKPVNVQSVDSNVLFESEKDFALKSESGGNDTDIEFLSRITTIIEEEIEDSKLNVTELCERHDINYKQFYRKLKQLTNSTPSDFIRSIRMKKAALLLQQPEFNISEIMYMVGYTNSSYFSKCFKSEFGYTPMQYRERLQNIRDRRRQH